MCNTLYVTAFQGMAPTKELELAPQLAFLTAHAVHNRSDVAETGLQLCAQLLGIISPPKLSFVKGERTRSLHLVRVHLHTKRTC